MAFNTRGANKMVAIMVGIAINAKALSIKFNIILNEVVAPKMILAI